MQPIKHNRMLHQFRIVNNTAYVDLGDGYECMVDVADLQRVQGYFLQLLIVTDKAYNFLEPGTSVSPTKIASVGIRMQDKGEDYDEYEDATGIHKDADEIAELQYVIAPFVAGHCITFRSENRLDFRRNNLMYKTVSKKGYFDWSEPAPQPKASSANAKTPQKAPAATAKPKSDPVTDTKLTVTPEQAAKINDMAKTLLDMLEVKQ